VVFDVFRISSVNYYILVTIDPCQSYSPRKTGLRFSLNAIKASVRSFVGNKVSYDARSKSKPVSSARSSERLIANFAAPNAKGAENYGY